MQAAARRVGATDRVCRNARRRRNIPMIRLGLSGRILGGPLAAIGRPAGHLSLNLLDLRDALAYLRERAIRLYRLPPTLLPGPATGWAAQVRECAGELAAFGGLARDQGLRLTIHASSGIALSTPDERIAAAGRLALEAQAACLAALADDGVIVVHIGGAYGEPRAALERCVRRIEALPEATRRLMALEPDGRLWSLVDALHVHAQTGVPIVFDHLHHLLHNPRGLPAATALNYALATWPPDRVPKAHFSSPRTELRIGARSGGRRYLEPPRWEEHSDYAHPFELIDFLRLPAARPFDLMLEAKAGDLAVLRARQAIQRFAPDLADAVA